MNFPRKKTPVKIKTPVGIGVGDRESVVVSLSFSQVETLFLHLKNLKNIKQKQYAVYTVVKLDILTKFLEGKMHSMIFS